MFGSGSPRAFLDAFGFDYEYKSATECYRQGLFDQALLAVLRHYDEILTVILPTLGPERRATCGPFLPLSPKTGRILQAPILGYDAESGIIVFKNEDGTKVETVVTGGSCKLQWKCDWAMRWVVFAVDYEMFLDAHGEKVSKSKGNGIAIEDWLTYAPPESLAFFMYQKPKASKRLYFDVIPRTVDDYLAELQQFTAQNLQQRLNTVVWHIHNSLPLQPEAGVSFSMLLNLVSVCHSDDPRVIWHYVTRYVPEATPETSPLLHQLVGHAIGYYKDFVRPAKHYRTATHDEKMALADLWHVLTSMPVAATSDDIQT